MKKVTTDEYNKLMLVMIRKNQKLSLDAQLAALLEEAAKYSIIEEKKMKDKDSPG